LLINKGTKFTTVLYVTIFGHVTSRDHKTRSRWFPIDGPLTRACISQFPRC